MKPRKADVARRRDGSHASTDGVAHSSAADPGDCLPYRASRFNYPNDDPTALFQTITYACGQNRAALFVTDNEVSTVIRLNFLAQETR